MIKSKWQKLYAVNCFYGKKNWNTWEKLKVKFSTLFFLLINICQWPMVTYYNMVVTNS